MRFFFFNLSKKANPLRIFSAFVRKLKFLRQIPHLSLRIKRVEKVNGGQMLTLTFIDHLCQAAQRKHQLLELTLGEMREKVRLILDLKTTKLVKN